MGEILRRLGQVLDLFILLGPAVVGIAAIAARDWDKAAFFLALQLGMWFAVSRA